MYMYPGQTRLAVNGCYPSYFARFVATLLQPYFDVPSTIKYSIFWPFTDINDSIRDGFQRIRSPYLSTWVYIEINSNNPGINMKTN